MMRWPTFRIAQACEKLNQSDEAVEHYEQYLRFCQMDHCPKKPRKRWRG